MIPIRPGTSFKNDQPRAQQRPAVLEIALLLFGSVAASSVQPAVAQGVTQPNIEVNLGPVAGINAGATLHLVLPPRPHGQIERVPEYIVRAAAEEVLYGGPDPTTVFLRELIDDAKRALREQASAQGQGPIAHDSSNSHIQR